MKKLFIVGVLFSTVLCGLSCSSTTSPHTNNNTDTAKVVYTCPMHPEVKKDKPGTCPICGMDLVKQSELDSAKK